MIKFDNIMKMFDILIYITLYIDFVMNFRGINIYLSPI